MAAFKVNCPITTEPIKVYGMTVLGNVYEYEEIVNWLRDNNTDPITNQMLPSTFVVKLTSPPKSDEELKSMQKNMRLSTKGWAGEITLVGYSVRFVERVDREKEAIETYKKTNPDEWEKFESTILEALSNPNVTSISCYFGRCYGRDEITIEGEHHKTQTIIYPGNISTGLSHLSFPRNVTKHKSFKSSSFNGSDLRKQTFYECDLSRTTFVRSDLRGTSFIRCHFIGENIHFAKCLTDTTTTFQECELERVGKWSICETTDEFRDTLVLRGMEDDCANKVIIK